MLSRSALSGIADSTQKIDMTEFGRYHVHHQIEHDYTNGKCLAIEILCSADKR